jgi:hypothetical protein
MRKALLGVGVAIAMGTAAPAWGKPDCGNNWHPVGKFPMWQVSLFIRLGEMACFDFDKDRFYDKYPELTAQQVLDGVTVFAYGNNGPVLIKGTNFPENSYLPPGSYKFLRLVTVTKANGFTTQLPLFQKK